MDLPTRDVKGISRAVLLLASAFLLMGVQPPASQQAKLEGAIIAAPRISPGCASPVAAGQALWCAPMRMRKVRHDDARRGDDP
jgi:hypothetical protein